MADDLKFTSVGTPRTRLEAPSKVRGAAAYAVEREAPDVAHAHLVCSTVARGCVSAIDTTQAAALDGVLAVVTHENARRLVDTGDLEMQILQNGDVHYRGQVVAVVVAETSEVARHAAELVEVAYEEHEHSAVLDDSSPQKYEQGDAIVVGDVDAGVGQSQVLVDQTYTTPREYHIAMEPHAATAHWLDDHLTLLNSTQGVYGVQTSLAKLFDLDPAAVDISSPYVGGAFGSKAGMRVHEVAVTLAAMAVPGRSIRLALTRQQTFDLTGYRPPTKQRVQLGVDADGRLTTVGHDSTEMTSRCKEFTEGAARTTAAMYATPNLRIRQFLVPADVNVPWWMRAPGEMPGLFALESAMDELSIASDIDPIELRRRNDPVTHPVDGKPFTQRKLTECFDLGARTFRWPGHNPHPRSRREGEWYLGVGVAAATFPAMHFPGSRARVVHPGDDRYVVQIAAADIGTGAQTALTMLAADALGVDAERVTVELGSTRLPKATPAGGSTGMASWGSTVAAACAEFRATHGTAPEAGADVTTKMPHMDVDERFAAGSFGANFCEVAVNGVTGEVRVPRLLGVFSIGQVINPTTARAQLVGGMVTGLGMALHEEAHVDPRYATVVGRDLASYHVPTHADVGEIDALMLDERDTDFDAVGARGAGEISGTGVAAAVANAVFDAVGVRIRDLPITPDKLISRLV